MGSEFNANHPRQWSSHIRDNAGDVGDALLDCPEMVKSTWWGNNPYLHVYTLYVNARECIWPKYVCMNVTFNLYLGQNYGSQRNHRVFRGSTCHLFLHT